MRLHIPLQEATSSGHSFSKGDRVVCKIAKNEWYIGTVVRAGLKVKVDFDDGFDAIIDENDFKHIKALVKDKKLKRALTDIEAKVLYEQKKTLKEAVQKKAEVKKPAVPEKKPAKVIVEVKKPFIPTAPPKAVIPTSPPKPVLKPVLVPVHAPAPPTPVPVAPIKPVERVYKNNWTIQLNASSARSWRYLVVDDPKEPSFKFGSSSISFTPIEALKHAMLSMKGEKFNVRISHPPTPGESTVVDELNALTKHNALDELAKLLKSKEPEPKPEPPKAPPPQRRPPVLPPEINHTPVIQSPTIHPAPNGEKPTWIIQLVPNSMLEWSFAVKDRTVDPRFIKTSRYEYENAFTALIEGLKNIPTGNTLTLSVADKVVGNAIVRSTVFDHITPQKAIDLVKRHYGTEEPTPTPDMDSDVKPYLQVADVINFDKAERGGDAHKIEYMKQVWARANTLIFGNHLMRANFRFLKDQKTKSFKRRGHWQASVRELAMSRRTFTAGEEKFLEIFVHEMCHQAVTDINHAIEGEGGHGPLWKSWMVKSGIPPSRYDMTDATQYMDDVEKARHDKKLTEYKKEMEQNDRTPLSNTAAPGTPCQIYLSERFKWVQGVTAGVNASKLIFLEEPSGNAWLTLGNQGRDRLFALPYGEMEQDFTSDQWKQAVKNVRNYLAHKAVQRKAKKLGGTIGRYF